ncbi:hypothetical protein [Streptomyces mirabilis]|uniref:hypothetical protein n=1 Tax=Streptomyces mirabilis TaxID=68239 RepID=UPI0033EF9B18
MDSTDPSRWDLLDDLLTNALTAIATTAGPSPAPNHWRFATTPPPHSSTATFSVASTTSRTWRQRRPQDAPPGPHCLHRAVSLDSSVPRISPMDPDIAQQHVESLILRGLAATFDSDYTFQAHRQRFGRYSAPVVRESGWAYDSHSLDRLGNALADIGPVEGHGEHRHNVLDSRDYFFMGASGSSQGIARLRTDLIGIDLIWASPECEPLWSPAGRRPGGDA